MKCMSPSPLYSYQPVGEPVTLTFSGTGENRELTAYEVSVDGTVIGVVCPVLGEVVDSFTRFPLYWSANADGTGEKYPTRLFAADAIREAAS